MLMFFAHPSAGSCLAALEVFAQHDGALAVMRSREPRSCVPGELLGVGLLLIPTFVPGCNGPLLFGWNEKKRRGELGDGPMVEGVPDSHALRYDQFQRGLMWKIRRRRLSKLEIVGLIEVVLIVLVNLWQLMWVNPSPILALDHFSRAYLLQKDGHYTAAIGEYTKAIAEKPNYAPAFANRGLSKYYAGDLEGALVDYDEAIRLNSFEGMPYSNRGLAKLAKGDKAGAFVDFSMAIKLNPTLIDPLGYRGAMNLSMGAFKDAVADLSRAIELNPHWGDYFNNRGAAFSFLEENEKALADFNRAIELSPKSATAFENRGCLKMKLGDKAGAVADLCNAMKLDESLAGRVTELLSKYRLSGGMEAQAGGSAF